jgi:uncharacterized membrane protein YdjX (TVP38/TMEM64 family)
MVADEGQKTEDQGRTADVVPSAASEVTAPARRRLAPWPLGLRVAMLLLVIIALAAPLILFREQIAAFANRETILAAVAWAGPWGPAILIGLIILQTIVAPIPGQALGLAAGYLYGFWGGLLYGWLGTVAGSVLAICLARFAGRPLVARLVRPEVLERLDRFAAGRGLLFFFLVFLIPGLPDDVLCFVAGLTRLPILALVALVAVARVPGIAAAIWLGASAERMGWQVWAVLGGLAAVVALVAWRFGGRLEEKLLELLNRST